MADESDGSRADAVQQFRKALDDDYKAALEDPAHDIVGRVRDGTITRAKAEEWALEQGRPPFASRPDPATFEPRGKRKWTLAQMAAWAIWRTDDAVRTVSEDYLCGCVEWVEAKHPRVRFISPVELEFASSTDRVGYELRSPKVPTAYDVLEDARHRALLGGPVPKLSPERAQHKMLDALQAGAPLVARHGEGEAIDQYLWDVLSPFSLGDDPHDAVFYPSGKVVRFHRVRVERDAVLAVWPAIPEDWIDSALENATTALVGPAGISEVGGRAAVGEPTAPVRQRRISEAELGDFVASLPTDPQLFRDEVVERVKHAFGDRAPGLNKIEAAYAKRYNKPRRAGEKKERPAESK